MRRNIKFHIPAIILAITIILHADIYAGDVDVELGSNNGDDAFRVLDSAGTSLLNVFSDGKVVIGTAFPEGTVKYYR